MRLGDLFLHLSFGSPPKLVNQRADNYVWTPKYFLRSKTKSRYSAVIARQTTTLHMSFLSFSGSLVVLRNRITLSEGSSSRQCFGGWNFDSCDISLEAYLWDSWNFDAILFHGASEHVRKGRGKSKLPRCSPGKDRFFCVCINLSWLKRRLVPRWWRQSWESWSSRAEPFRRTNRVSKHLNNTDRICKVPSEATRQHMS